MFLFLFIFFRHIVVIIKNSVNVTGIFNELMKFSIIRYRFYWRYPNFFDILVK